jgi:hypothetical protein
MHPYSDDPITHTPLRTFERNRYFHGKLLDVFHFELEQNYLNGKRWLLNRLISGYGVLCGLDVQPAREGRAVCVTPGVALDRGGHEIIVPRPSGPLVLPPRPAAPEGGNGESRKDDFVHVCIAFNPCEAEQTPVLVDDCGQVQSCSASAVQERYKLFLRDGKAPEIACECRVPEVIASGRLNYAMLVERVTRHCPSVPADLCIPLANICLNPGDGPVAASNIDICVRPIVYTNDLLFDIILSLSGDPAAHPRGGKK